MSNLIKKCLFPFFFIIIFCLILYLSIQKQSLYAAEIPIQKVLKFGIMKYLIGHYNEYSGLIFGVEHLPKNHLYIPTGIFPGKRGHDALIYDYINQKINSTIQLKRFRCGVDIHHMLPKWNLASMYSDFLWVDFTDQIYFNLVKENPSLLNNFPFLKSKLSIFHLNNILFNYDVNKVNEIQSKIDYNNDILGDILKNHNSAINDVIIKENGVGLESQYLNVFYKYNSLKKASLTNIPLEEQKIIKELLNNQEMVRSTFEKAGIK